MFANVTSFPVLNPVQYYMEKCREGEGKKFDTFLHLKKITFQLGFNWTYFKHSKEPKRPSSFTMCELIESSASVQHNAIKTVKAFPSLLVNFKNKG